MNPLARSTYLDTVIPALSYLQLCVQNYDVVQLYDINIASEHFFARFLSVTHQCHLTDLNTITGTHPGIDLGDAAIGTCFQITSDARKAKVAKTLEKYEKFNLWNTYPHLRVMIIGARRGNYEGLKLTNGGIFDVSKDIIGIPNLAKLIKTLDTPKLQRLDLIVRTEMPAFAQITSTQGHTDLRALEEYRSYFDRRALLDPWYAEYNYKGFGEALTDLIELLNNGTVRDQPVTKKRCKISDRQVRMELASISEQLAKLRQLFTVHIRSGEINIAANTCNFTNPMTALTFDTLRRVILADMNSLMARFGLQQIV